MRFLFYSEFLMNDSACMIHEGYKIPGRGGKCSSLIREFSMNGEFQHRVTKGETSKLTRSIFLTSKNMVRLRNRTLTFREYQDMQRHLEHDKMLFSNYDRQSAVFENERGLIDEFEFMKCNRHDSSPLTLSDWLLVTDVNNSLMICGLRSPCINSCYHFDGVDRLGKEIRMFDGVFESE